MALMKISEFQERFTKQSRPSNDTVARWIKAGKIYGKKIGKQYYVDPDKEIVTAVNELVLRVANG